MVGLAAEVTGAVVECKPHRGYSAVLSVCATYKCLGYPLKGYLCLTDDFCPPHEHLNTQIALCYPKFCIYIGLSTLNP